MKIECVIFDLDGTLVDSEGICNQAFLDLLPELRSSREELVARYRGKKLALIIQDIERVIGRALPRGFEKDYRARVVELFDAELKPIPGVHQMLETLEYPYCVASSGPMKKIRKALKISSLESFFGERIFSSYEVGSWKPEPGLFLHACAAMGFAPESCAVVEDSPPGITAAIAAGMSPFRYLPDGYEDPDPKVTSFCDMNSLASLLKAGRIAPSEPDESENGDTSPPLN